LLGLFFNATPPTDFASSKASDAKAYAAFFHQLLDRGVALPPSPFESLFPSLAHSHQEIERTVDVAAAAARAIE